MPTRHCPVPVLSRSAKTSFPGRGPLRYAPWSFSPGRQKLAGPVFRPASAVPAPTLEWSRLGILACAFPATTRPTTLSASTRKQDSRTAPATRATGLAPSATVFRRPRRKSVAVVRVLAGRCLGPVLVGRFPRTEVGRKRYPDNLCEPPLVWSNFFKI